MWKKKYVELEYEVDHVGKQNSFPPPAALAAAVTAPHVLHRAHRESLCMTGEEWETATVKTSTDYAG